jgi:hypothetical protein
VAGQSAKPDVARDEAIATGRAAIEGLRKSGDEKNADQFQKEIGQGR